MLNKKMVKALNAHTVVEAEASQVYLGMAYDMHDAGLEGTATWLEKQSDEEWKHATRILDFLNDLGYQVTIPERKAVEGKSEDLGNTFKAIQELEQRVSGLINDLVGQAQTLGDWQAFHFLLWYVDEQTTSERFCQTALDKLKSLPPHEFDEWIGGL